MWGHFGCWRVQDLLRMAESTCVRVMRLGVHEAVCPIHVGPRTPKKRLKSSEGIYKYTLNSINNNMNDNNNNMLV